MHLVLLGYPGHLLLDPDALQASAKRHGVDLTFETPDQLAVAITRGDVHVTLRGDRLVCDAAIVRGTTPVNPFLLTALEVLERDGVAVVNPPETTRVCEDKLRTAVALHDGGVLQLPTVAMLPGGTVPDWGGPLYTKAAWGSRGRGTTRHPDRHTAQDALTAARAATLAGPFVEHVVLQPPATSRAGDYRVHVVDGQALVVIERRLQPGSAVSTGSGSIKRAVDVNDVPEMADLAVAATRAVGALYAGVDLVIHDGQPHVLEVNASPGLEVTGRLSGLDLEDRLLQLACDEALRRQP